MKTVVVSILLALFVALASEPVKPKKEEVDVDAILNRCNKNISKATTVTRIADKQQKAKMTELHETVEKLEEEKKELETVLIETKHELQTVKEVINNNVADTGQQFDLFPEN
jgi:SpoVK/Ycf46/Vps4 family AAA+-type ATPase